MTSPRISVLLPVRNARETLDPAVRSIVEQTLQDWELVVVDDGSSDGSGELLSRWSAEDGRIRTVSQPPKGLIPALERARREARAPLLARMDADDRAHPERLEAQLQRMEEGPDAVLVGTHVRYFPRARVKGGAIRYEAWLNSMRDADDLERNLWVECPLAHPTFLARADAVQAVGGYRDMGWPEDYDLLLRVWSRGGGLGVVPRVLLDWRESASRLSRIHPRYSEEAFRRIKLHFLVRTLLRGRNGLLVWGAGPVGKRFARAALEGGVAVQAFVDLDPRKVGQEIHGAPVVAPEAVAGFRGALGVAAVGQEGARDEIRAAFRKAGWREGTDFVAVA